MATPLAGATTFHFPIDDPDWPYDITTATAYVDTDDAIALAILFACSEEALVTGAGFNLPPGAGLQGRAELWSGNTPTTQMAVGSYQALVVGWNDLPLTPTAVTTGIDYWIAVRLSGTEVRYRALPNVYVSGNPRYEAGPAYVEAGTANAGRYAYHDSSMTAGSYAQSSAWYGVTLSIEGAGAPVTGTGISTGDITWAGVATGKQTPKATGTGTITWAGAAAGKQTPKATTAGAVSFAGLASGKCTPEADSVGAIAWDGSATGKRVARAAVSGAITWVGAVVGIRRPLGRVVGGLAWTGSAVGRAPVPLDLNRPRMTSRSAQFAGTALGAAEFAGTGTAAGFSGPVRTAEFIERG